MTDKIWDAFISHASEDKDEIARPLFEFLSKCGANIWFDEDAIALGDSLTRAIDNGLSMSNYGIVIISQKFIEKDFTDYELRGLLAKEMGADKVIIPIWHNLSREDILRFSPTLADKYAIVTNKNPLQNLGMQILKVICPNAFTSLNRRLARKSAISTGITKQVKLSDIKLSAPRHKELPVELVDRVRLIRASVSDIMPMSLEAWLYGFRCDSNPSREIHLWEIIAANYLEIKSFLDINAGDLKPILSVLLAAISGHKPDIVNSLCQVRTELQMPIIEIITSEGKSNKFPNEKAHNEVDILEKDTDNFFVESFEDNEHLIPDEFIDELYNTLSKK
jgi:hypothetical protein